MPEFNVRLIDGRTLEMESPDLKTAQTDALEWSRLNPKQGTDPLRGQAYQAQRLQSDRGGALNNIGGVIDSATSSIPLYHDIQAGVAAIADPLTWQGHPVQAYQRQREGVRAGTESFAARQPVAANVAKTATLGASMLVPGGPMAQVSRAPAGASVAARAGNTALNATRGAVAAGTAGAIYGLGGDGTPEQRLENARNGAALAAALGAPLGAVAGRSPRGAPKPAAQTPRQGQVNLLLNEGVNLTPGQAKGGVAKALEDAGTSIPYLGTKITEARNTGIEQFGRASLNRGLKEVGKELPADAVGNDAVEAAQRIYNDLYDAAKPPGNIRLDDGFRDALVSRADDIALLEPANQARLENMVTSIVGSRTSVAELSPAAFQRAHSQLRTQADRFSKSGDPDHQTMADVLRDVRTALRENAGRQHRGFDQQLSTLNRAYAGFKQAQNAATRPTDASGIFTPAQYAAAVKKGDTSLDKGRWAAGQSLNHDLSAAGQAVLPSKIGNSGTADRSAAQALLAVPAGLAGLAAGGPPGAIIGAGAGIAAVPALARRYTPEAIAAYNATLRSGIPGSEAQRALEALRSIAANDPKANELYRDALSRMLTTVGAGSSAIAGAAQ